MEKVYNNLERPMKRKLYKIDHMYFLYNDKTKELLLEESLYNFVVRDEYTSKLYKPKDKINFHYYRLSHITSHNFLKALEERYL